MTIPITSNYPTSIDEDDTLFLVHDGLRVKLGRDYNVGDTTITIYGDAEIINRFPPTGIITLTEQCSDADVRAISFYYGSRTVISFDQLELLSGFTDTVKPKDITNVTQNVMAQHHNMLKDAIVNVQNMTGKKGAIANQPLVGTMEERINYLRKIALIPKGWFTSNKKIGLIPLTVEFTDLSFRLGTDGTTGTISYIWDFGDNTGPSIVTISTTEGPVTQDNVIVEDLDGGTITKIYTKPGIYDVKLTITNDFGYDEVVFPQYINARVQAPEEAIVNFNVRAGQFLIQNAFPTNGPYTTTPIIRTSINTFVDMEIPSGVNPNTGRSYAGEELSGGSPIDPISNYTWYLSDDLIHSNSTNARAAYSIGGLYDLILRVDTSYGSYRITSYENAVNVIERYNLWLWNFTSLNQVSSYEFGLISETFKTNFTNPLTVNIDDSFLTGQPNENQQKMEFNRNNGFAPRSATTSGNGGVGLLFYASGRGIGDPSSNENIHLNEFNGFTQTYVNQPSLSRPWNWISMSSGTNLYFILGGITTAQLPNNSLTNQNKITYNLQNLSSSNSTIATSNYKNGADELLKNEVTYDISGNSNQGNMSVYRSCWKDSAGFFMRNQGVGDFFRIKSFYKTSGTTTDYFVDIRKLNDMSGSTKVEGQLVTLSQGVYFFNNSGSISAYNPTSNVWETGGTGVNSSSFRLLQDNTVSGYDNATQTLVATSDNDKIAYLSFDYSNKAYIKFNETTLTFSNVSNRPSGNQWIMSIF